MTPAAQFMALRPAGGFGMIMADPPWPISTITIEGPVRGHSVKPDAGYAAAVELMPEVRRLELFSRTDRAGWSVWGDEAGKLGVAP